MYELQMLLKELGAYRVEFRVGYNVFSLNGLFVVGFIFVVIAAYIRGRSLDWYQAWQTANEQVDRQFDPSPPPLFVTAQGCIGLVFAIIGRTLFWLFILIGFDLAFTGGHILIDVLRIAMH